MGLSKKFPKNPYDLIDPDVRWFPGNETLGEKGRENFSHL